MDKKFLLENKKFKRQDGFVLLFSVLVATLVLAVGISIINITLKQLVLSGTGRDSQFAFYAANTGAECAFYWDLRGDTKSGNGKVFYDNSGGPTTDTDVKCLGVSIVDDNSVCSGSPESDSGWCASYDNGSVYKTKFRIKFDNSFIADKDKLPYCADVIVKKQTETKNGETYVATTTITSRGYNTCDQNNPRRVERALEFYY